MLIRLFIQNYALIREVSIDFGPGLNIITGETGAGKSILLGALGLIAGNRADSSVLSSTQKKCVVEGLFDISTLNLKSFFDQHELDYDDNCIIRREIMPGGKSRAFINDTPVGLPVLRASSDMLIDIHSQHQTLLLRDNDFQMQLIDSYADNEADLDKLAELYKRWKAASLELEQIMHMREIGQAERDFIRYQYDELEKAMIVAGEEEQAELELESLSHSEELKVWFENTMRLMSDDEDSVQNKLSSIKQSMQKAVSWYRPLHELLEQLNMISVDVKEWMRTVSQLSDSIDSDPERLKYLEERMNLIHTLLRKHRVNTTAELLALKVEWEQKLLSIESGEERESALRKMVQQLLAEIENRCHAISQKRLQASKLIEERLLLFLSQLGLKDARLEIKIEPKQSISSMGYDNVQFLFSANPGMPLQDLGKIASGGEVSRLMLACKALLSDKRHLSTILFDEIDTGVSGGMADKIGQLLNQMSKNRQLIVITHLPQIASKGDKHFKVSKESNKTGTQSQLYLLDKTQRIEEIARLLSGETVTEAALKNAKALLSVQGGLIL